METKPQFKLWATQFDTSGRVHVPSELRKAIKATAGSPVIWERTDAGILLRPYEEVIADVQSHFCGIGEPDDVWFQTATSK